jgi:hypothetical protein
VEHKKYTIHIFTHNIAKNKFAEDTFWKLKENDKIMFANK